MGGTNKHQENTSPSLSKNSSDNSVDKYLQPQDTSPSESKIKVALKSLKSSLLSLGKTSSKTKISLTTDELTSLSVEDEKFIHITKSLGDLSAALSVVKGNSPLHIKSLSYNEHFSDISDLSGLSDMEI